MNPFTISDFATACEAAMAEAEDPQRAAHDHLEAAIAESGAEHIIETLDAAIPPGADIGEMIVHTSPQLTLLDGRVPPRFQSGIHNHTIFACIGQLVGEEVNTIYERDPERGGLKVARTMSVRAGEVIDLPADAIHSIENPRQERGSALHMYGGDFKAIMEQRSLWSSEGHEELPFSFELLLRESASAMLRDENRTGLEELVKAIPAAAAMVSALIASRSGISGSAAAS